MCSSAPARLPLFVWLHLGKDPRCQSESVLQADRSPSEVQILVVGQVAAYLLTHPVGEVKVEGCSEASGEERAA